MKKVILSMLCLFAVSTIAHSTILGGRNCVEEAINAGNSAEQGGASFNDAYDAADLAYLRCEADK